VRSYSNRQDVLHHLKTTVRVLAEPPADPDPEVLRSVRRESPGGQVPPPRPLAERLSSEEIQGLVAAFRSGTPKTKLADQYGISLSSVKRLLRKYRTEG